MESRYGIGVNNRYALFLDSDNEDGDSIEEIMMKKTHISADNQKKTTKDSQTNVTAKKDANNKTANKDSTKANNRDGKLSFNTQIVWFESNIVDCIGTTSKGKSAQIYLWCLTKCF